MFADLDEGKVTAGLRVGTGKGSNIGEILSAYMIAYMIAITQLYI